MFSAKKYKLLPKETVDYRRRTLELHRIQALRDIPTHNVKAGDLGGYVAGRKTLSHEGECWVGGNAIVTGVDNAGMVTGDALVTDDAFLEGNISGTSRIHGNAKAKGYFYGRCDISGNVKIERAYLDGRVILRDNAKFVQGSITAKSGKGVIISGDAVINCPSVATKPGMGPQHFIVLGPGDFVDITGNVSLDTVFITGNCKLDGDFHLENVSFKGDNLITGSPQIKPDTQFSGSNVISGSAVIPPGSHVNGVVMSGGVLDYSAPGFADKSVTGAVFTPALAVPVPMVAFNEVNEYVSLIEQIEAEYEAYTTDIVKLIKYPAMVDTSVPEVGDFVVKLRAAKRAVKASNMERVQELAEALDLAFVNAENKVQTLVASHLDESKKKSLKTAEKMFKLACDDASPEPEKRLGFKAGMRALEGVVVVSDKATENLKARIGILELEA